MSYKCTVDRTKCQILIYQHYLSFQFIYPYNKEDVTKGYIRKLVLNLGESVKKTVQKVNEKTRAVEQKSFIEIQQENKNNAEAAYFDSAVLISYLVNSLSR